MRKRILLASAVGIGAGLAYLLTRAVDEKEENLNANGGNAGALGDSGDRIRGSAPQSVTQLETAADAGDNGQQKNELLIDDQGTDQFEATNILKNIRDATFDGSDEKLALALGRPPDEIESWTGGSGTIDGDVVMKARKLALARGIQ